MPTRPLPDPERQLAIELLEIKRRIAALEGALTLQATTISGGALVLRGGELRIQDDAGSDLVLVDGDGLHVIAATGDDVVDVDRDGVHVINSSGVVQARLGHLADGSYGVEVDDATGTPINVNASLFGLSSASIAAFDVLTTSPTNYGPTVNITVGNTGKVLVILTAELQVTISPAVPSNNAVAVVYVDGVASDLIVTHRLNDSTASCGLQSKGSFAKALVFTGLSPGNHTLDVRASCLNAVPACRLDTRTVSAFPI